MLSLSNFNYHTQDFLFNITFYDLFDEIYCKKFTFIFTIPIPIPSYKTDLAPLLIHTLSLLTCILLVFIYYLFTAVYESKLETLSQKHAKNLFCSCFPSWIFCNNYNSELACNGKFCTFCNEASTLFLIRIQCEKNNNQLITWCKFRQNTK